jgi:hypothetical protein
MVASSTLPILRISFVIGTAVINTHTTNSLVTAWLPPHKYWYKTTVSMLVQNNNIDDLQTIKERARESFEFIGNFAKRGV